MCWNKCLKIHIFDTVKSCAYLTSTCLQIKIDMRRHETGTQIQHSAFCRGQGIVLSPAPTLTIVTTISIWVRVKAESDLRPRLRARRKMYRGHGAELRSVSASLLSSARVECGMWRCPGPRHCHQPYYCCFGQSRWPLPPCSSSPLKMF